MTISSLYQAHKKSVHLGALVVLMLALLTWLRLASQEQLLASQLQYDRVSLQQFFAPGSYDNDLVLDTFLIPAREQHDTLINLHLLGLRRDRFAYLARKAGEVVAIAVPATADDGFNGHIDLLVGIDMFGRITAARVIEDINTNSLYGVIDVIRSSWMEEFAGNAMRDIRRLSWERIEADNEYDQFVGASITPKAVADRIYNAMVFFQSNRITLMRGESSRHDR